MSNVQSPTYKLRFFFDYNCGGCLWSENEDARKMFGTGPLDAEIYDLNGKVIQEARIKLPESIREKVLELDKHFSESLDGDNPGGNSVWNDAEWNDFHTKTKALFKEVSDVLHDNFEIIYMQES